MKQFNWKKFLYYICYIAISGIVIGYAESVASEADTIYRLRAVFVVGASLFGILIMVSSIMIDVLLMQKGRLGELVRENNRCIEEQTKQYICQSQKDAELKKFRHDYNAHIQALQRLSEQGELQKLRDYVTNMQEMKRAFDAINTNNVIGDAIINQFYEKGLNENIEVSVIGNFPDVMPISETDLCILLSNTVKNAYEATQKCDECRKVSIEIGVYQQKVLLTIKNPVIKEPIIRDGLIETSKTDTENHGIGLKNVVDVIEENNAHFEMNYQNGFVKTEMLL